MKKRSCRYALFLVLFLIGVGSRSDCAELGSQASVSDWADLRITFIYDAPECPSRRRIDPLADANCMPESLMPLSEELIVDPDTMGIQNITMYLDPKNSGLQESDTHPELRMPPAEPSLFHVRGCVFEPHVFISRVGQRIRVINSDEYGHNPNFVFFANGLESRMHPPGQTVELEILASEKAPSPIFCNIHPWMRAYVLVFQHPYVGISDNRGVLNISKLPAGKVINFKVWHESMVKTIDQVTFENKPTLWDKGNVQLKLHSGLNDLGVVKITPDKFKNK